MTPPQAVLAVGEAGQDREPALAADAHAGDAFIPALDDIACAEREVERIAPRAARVELTAAVGEPADVHDDVSPSPAGAPAPTTRSSLTTAPEIKSSGASLRAFFEGARIVRR